MSVSKHKILLEKSIDACLAAIEIYNKPIFRYREETFSILMLNAWELLLKARIIQENKGDVRAIEIREQVTRKDGTQSIRERKKKNRSGNTMTIGIEQAKKFVSGYSKNGINASCIENLSLLTEIRDNAIHLHNIDAGLSQRIQEVGTATLKNFVLAAERWFKFDFSEYNFFLMPLSFQSPLDMFESLNSTKQPSAVKRLLTRITNAERDNSFDDEEQFSVTVGIQVNFIRTPNKNAIPVRLDKNNPDATVIRLTEDNIRQQFPWDYNTLTSNLKKRYSNFVQNNNYHKHRKSLKKMTDIVAFAT